MPFFRIMRYFLKYLKYIPLRMHSSIWRTIKAQRSVTEIKNFIERENIHVYKLQIKFREGLHVYTQSFENFSPIVVRLRTVRLFHFMKRQHHVGPPIKFSIFISSAKCQASILILHVKIGTPPPPSSPESKSTNEFLFTKLCMMTAKDVYFAGFYHIFCHNLTFNSFISNSLVTSRLPTTSAFSITLNSIV